MRFYEVLHEYRVASGYSLQQVAKRSKIPKATIQSWEEGRVKRPRNRISILCVCAGLRLTISKSNRLLTSAEHPLTSLDDIKDITGEMPPKKPAHSVLADWADWIEESQNQSAVACSRLIAPFQAPPRLLNFVGRKSLMDEVTTALLGTDQVCILQGMSGVGKSAIATEIAYSVRKNYPDGVLWAQFDNDALAVNPDQVAQQTLESFARALGLIANDSSSGVMPLKHILGVLAQKRILIIYDGLESSELAKRLLPPTTGTHAVLITTQNRSMLASLARSFDVQTFDMLESLSLLRKVAGDERINTDLKSAYKIIHLLEGHALALKLVASDIFITFDLTLYEILEELEEEKLHLKLSGAHPTDNLSVRASFEVAYSRLSNDEQRLFASLHAFTGRSFTSEAVAAVFKTKVRKAKLALGRLYSLSFAERTNAQTTRYHLHTLLYLFAEEKARELALPSDEYQRRLLNHFVESTRQLDTHEYHLVEPDWENIKGALDWACRNQEWLIVQQMMRALTETYLGMIGFLDAQGHWGDARMLLTWLLEHEESIGAEFERGEFLWKRGVFALRQLNYEAADADLQAAYQLFTTMIANDCINLHKAYLAEFLARRSMEADLESALTFIEEGLTVLAGIEDKKAQHQRGNLRVVRSTILGRQLGDFHASQAEIQKAMALLPDQPSAALLSAINNQLVIAIYSQDTASARQYAPIAIKIAKALNDLRRLGLIHMNMGIVEHREGALEASQQHSQDALALVEHIGDHYLMCGVLNNLGMVYRERRQFELAVEVLQQAIELGGVYQIRKGEATARTTLAQLWIETNELASAENELTVARRLTRNYRLQEVKSTIFTAEAQLALAKHQFEDAVHRADIAINIAKQDKQPLEEGVALLTKGRALLALGRTDKAKATLQAALVTLQGQDHFTLMRTQQILATLL